ncbi:MAG: hypothetical protein WBX27_20615 [Specibacter sp.]
MEFVNDSTNVTWSGRSRNFPAEPPRFNPRHRPGAWDPATYDLQEVAQLAGKSAGRVMNDHQANQVNVWGIS